MTDSQAATTPGIPMPSKPIDPPAADGIAGFRAVPSQHATAVNLGPLRNLPGFWEGTGFNMIARPDFSGDSPNGFFLELNMLRESIEFTTIGSPVFNRGSAQDDVSIYGVTYLHRVTDAGNGEALHIEPGVWLTIPPTTDPPAGPTIARLATIPHGNAVCTVGFTQEVDSDQLPTIPPANTVPFPFGSQPPPPGTRNPYPEYDLSTPSRFRTPSLPPEVTQAVVDDPNAMLRDALQGHVLPHITRLITTADQAQIGNIPFIVRNADTISLESVFAIETVEGPEGTEYQQLQYSQTALLNFRGLSFPHVTVGTLIKAF
jgi:hypothetical protein